MKNDREAWWEKRPRPKVGGVPSASKSLETGDHFSLGRVPHLLRETSIPSAQKTLSKRVKTSSLSPSPKIMPSPALTALLEASPLL